MEILRRIGNAGAMRNAGLSADYPNDVAFPTTATRIEMARIAIPWRAAALYRKGGPDTRWSTSET